MESLVTWFAATLGPYISEKAVVFLISMMPLLELRGGLLASSLLKVSAVQAIPICIIGNILPIPFILLFIKKIFQWMKKVKCFRGLIIKLEIGRWEEATRSSSMSSGGWCFLWESRFREPARGPVR